MYYNLGRKEVLKNLGSSESGLSEKRVSQLFKKYGLNKLKRTHKISPLKIFISQFFDSVVLILILATIVSLFVKEFLDAIVILAIILLNAIMGFFQEYKAERSIELLQSLSVPKAKVIRNGKQKLISSDRLVPGDIIVFEAGDKISADSRLLSEQNLGMDESILTGESTTVSKQLLAIGHKVVVSDRSNMIFSGTTVSRGRGKAVVTDTGMSTEIGKIAKLVQEITTTSTPLQKKFKKLGVKLAALSVLVSVLVFFLGLWKGMELVDILLSAISLAVAVIPEGLPAVVTISLALGVQRMLKKKALIRKLRAVETLGSTNVICADKTGTITKNEMTVKKIFVNNMYVDVTGEGYDVVGKFFSKKKLVDPHKFTDLFNIAASCNNSELPNIGDPTELALLVLAKKAGVNKIKERIHEIAFDSKKKYMETTHKIHGSEVSYLKGAPEVILDFCDYAEINDKVVKLTSAGKKKFLKVNHEMTSNALRVLGLAYKKAGKTIFVGLAGMIDPPRNEVKDAIKIAYKAGIGVVMITGDHKNTARAVAHKVGILGDVVEGKDIEKSNVHMLVKEHKIFARVDPEHKTMILDAFQKRGEVVAMTGDGINDAPALKKADVGIAMSIKGTDVSRDASDMILVDDNFASIVSAVGEGRVIYDNIKKFVKYLLSANLAEIGVIVFSLLLNIPLPLLPLQILWVNLVTDGLPALALGVDNPSGDVMKRKPRSKNETILKNTYGFIFFGGLLGTIVVLGLYYFNLSEGLARARTIALTTLILFELFLAFSARSNESVFKLKRNKWLWGAVTLSLVLHLIVVYSPLNIAFKLVPLGLAEWGVIILLSSIGFVFFEVKKLIWH